MISIFDIGSTVKIPRVRLLCCVCFAELLLAGESIDIKRVPNPNIGEKEK